ncbi:protein of unknown function [Thalassovita litoralis]|uniref:DUF3576 domain-containing protein n=1 Tax=Thalassovita litoralis TaxID=1010611 RepID=A0A521APA3_9RHOB|nr:DUF3576 domain-containing protein [Thalassovita litoralis]SMO36669.1 protein of unknown function [Thalassovita litoralis]
MTFTNIKMTALGLALATALAGCGGGAPNEDSELVNLAPDERVARTQGTTLWDAFRRKNSDVNVAVNRFIWNASLEVLNFLPVESVDPFTGVIVMGYGTPPGGGTAYRATVYVKDPALEARSLVVAMQTRGGRPISASTQRAVEDAILSRARELRIADKKF